MTNQFLLIKCIVMGALSFPTPFLILFFLTDIVTPDHFARFIVVIFLLLAGGMIGIVSFYKDNALNALKEWFPSEGVADTRRR